MNHSKFRDELGKPNLTPDIIDDFVTWLCDHHFDLNQFRTENVQYKRRIFQEFWKEYPGEKKQFEIYFPN